MRIPKTMVSWFIATRRPLMAAGAISEIYMGDSIDAIPTPAPAANLATRKRSRLGANAMASEETANNAAASIRPGLRPYLSATCPANMQPAMAPMANMPVAKPSQ